MKKVLIVDDSETIRITVAAALEGSGFSVVQAVDGLDGLAQLEKHVVGLVILDINMPRMGGLEMLEKIHEEVKFSEIPVVMLTTEAHFSQIERAKKLGARGWIVKPAKPESLVAIARKILS